MTGLTCVALKVIWVELTAAQRAYYKALYEGQVR
jgi:hypothetical protein